MSTGACVNRAQGRSCGAAQAQHTAGTVVLASGAHLVQAQQGGVHHVAAVLQARHLAQVHQLLLAGALQVARVQLPAVGRRRREGWGQ